MEADWETIQFIGAILQLRLDQAGTLTGRRAVARVLRARENQP
jgi:hypothetical protein